MDKAPKGYVLAEPDTSRGMRWDSSTLRPFQWVRQMCRLGRNGFTGDPPKVCGSVSITRKAGSTGRIPEAMAGVSLAVQGEVRGQVIGGSCSLQGRQTPASPGCKHRVLAMPCYSDSNSRQASQLIPTQNQSSLPLQCRMAPGLKEHPEGDWSKVH